MKMKIGILAILGMVLFSVNSQAQNARRNSCVKGISNLTEAQISSIIALEDNQNKQMDAFRAERQKTTDLKEKQNIRTKMLEARTENQKQVAGLLNPEQKKEYAAWLDARKSNGNNDGVQTGKSGKKGSGMGAGKGQGQGKGQGSKMGSGKGSCMNAK